DAVTRIANDRALKAMIVTGAGRGFCAGADLKAAGRDASSNTSPSGDPYMLQPWSSPGLPQALFNGKPAIAAINGPAVGVGFTMSLACDIRLASSEARFSARFVRVGLVPESGSTRYLPLVAGFSNALLLSLTGRIIDADEALARGLVEKIVAPENLLEEAFALAEEISSSPIDSVWMAKRLIHQNAVEQDLRRVVDSENSAIRDMRGLPGHREAVTAFRERRQPRFDE
ncbi:MAG: enoyl-CoA hydratase, partial [Dehalococcoidia bacterium]|nr:enoyl-CoA hydratase [Dehalococcoidia bacterium]